MNIETAADIAWTALKSGIRPAPALRHKLSVNEAYQVQKALLQRSLGEGEELAGWKIGGNSDTARRVIGPEAPFSGFLLRSGALNSGDTINKADFAFPPIIECEVCITIGRSLPGGPLTRQDILAAASEIAPAFEISNLARVDGLDGCHLISDNVSQWGYVLGTPIAAGASHVDLENMEVVLKRSGSVIERGFARDTVDNLLESVIWLAGNLASLGLALEPGHKIMTGSCLSPRPVDAGAVYEADFAGLGRVSLRVD